VPIDRSRDRNRSLDRDADGGRSRPPSRHRQANSDDQALSLRDSGRTFAAVASALGFKRAKDARAAFLRALARQSDAERERLCERERERLDKLEARIRDRDREDPEKMERRLQGLEQMRETLPRV
jgi:hypothetical protein